MTSHSERMEILDRLERGEITPAEAAELLSKEQPGGGKPPQPETAMGVLEQLERGEINTEQAAERISASMGSRQDQRASVQPQRVEVMDKKHVVVPGYSWVWWVVPLAVGIVFTLLAGFWMQADASDGGLGFGFLCAWVPMLLGVGLIILAWVSQRGPWAQIRVHTHNRKVDVDVDTQVPIGVATTALKTLGRRIPGIDKADVERLTRAFEEIRRTGTPIHIQANDDDEENAVDITIG